MYSAVYKTSAKTTSLMLTHFLRCAAPLKLGTSAVLVKIAIILMKSEAMIGDGDLKVDSPVLDYDHQVEALTEAGFALWDVVTKNLGIFWLDQNVCRYTFIKFPESSLAMQ